MRIVVMSDTHLDRVTDRFSEICERWCGTADLVIHLGDWTRGIILEYLEQYPLEAVAGNMDDRVITERLPPQKVVTIAGRRIGIIHGWGSPTGLRRRILSALPDVEAILFGHTHQAMQTVENGIFWFNPGSVFSGRGNLPMSLGVLEIGERIHGEIVAL